MGQNVYLHCLNVQLWQILNSTHIEIKGSAKSI